MAKTKTNKTKIDNTTVTPSSGNIFKDIGLPNAEDLLVKARLTSFINKAIQERGWTQKQAAKELGTTQPKISDLSRGRIKTFSIEKLMSFLTDLDHDVAITVKKGRRKENRIVIPKKVTKEKSKTARDVRV